MELPNIEYKGNISKDVIAKDDYYQQLHYYVTYDDFFDEVSYSKFIKETERLVRIDRDYKVFVDFVKHVLGLDFCQVFSHVYDKVDATIEFHHGPIFTLYDICEIELTKFLKDGLKTNEFLVADAVLDLHFDLLINGVMLSKTVHEMAHNGDMFISLSQNIGDVNTYIKSREKYFTPELRYKLWTYAQLCKNNPSFDKGALDLEVVKNYLKP